jgi:multimeric flavodoxin WrbA
MKRILAFNGSPRPSGNTVHLLQSFLEGSREHGAETETLASHELKLRDCTGCLRCNVLGRCSLSGDDWASVSEKILDSEVLVFASPVYFHHLPASLKRVLDRFRSFAHVQLTENGLIHTPHQAWNKDFVLLLSQGNRDPRDARPVIDLFSYVCEIMGRENRLHVITGTGLAMVNQVMKDEEGLSEQYVKLGLPRDLAPADAERNRNLLEECHALGKKLSA